MGTGTHPNITEAQDTGLLRNSSLTVWTGPRARPHAKTVRAGPRARLHTKTVWTGPRARPNPTKYTLCIILILSHTVSKIMTIHSPVGIFSHSLLEICLAYLEVYGMVSLT